MLLVNWLNQTVYFLQHLFLFNLLFHVVFRIPNRNQTLKKTHFFALWKLSWLIFSIMRKMLLRNSAICTSHNINVLENWLSENRLTIFKFISIKLSIVQSRKFFLTLEIFKFFPHTVFLVHDFFTFKLALFLRSTLHQLSYLIEVIITNSHVDRLRRLLNFFISGKLFVILILWQNETVTEYISFIKCNNFISLSFKKSLMLFCLFYLFFFCNNSCFQAFLNLKPHCTILYFFTKSSFIF